MWVKGTGEVSHVQSRCGDCSWAFWLWVRQRVGTWQENEYGYDVNTSVTLNQRVPEQGISLFRHGVCITPCSLPSALYSLYQIHLNVHILPEKIIVPSKKIPVMAQDNDSEGSQNVICICQFRVLSKC